MRKITKSMGQTQKKVLICQSEFVMIVLVKEPGKNRENIGLCKERFL